MTVITHAFQKLTRRNQVLVGVLLLLFACCSLCLIYGLADNTARRIGILPTRTPTPVRSATPTATRKPTRTPVPTRTPKPTAYPTKAATARPTATRIPAATLAPASTSAPVCDCSVNRYNCTPDFVTHRAAQACYDYCVSQGLGDIHELDKDGNGSACESLP